MSGKYTGLPSGFVFVGNCMRTEDRIDRLHAAGIASARFGEVALDINGNRLSETYAPIWISTADVDRYNAFMMEKTFGPHWR